MTNDCQHMMACDIFNIAVNIQTTTFILSIWDQCTSLFCSQSILIILESEKMSWFEIRWSTGHVGLDMSNDSGEINCAGDVICSWNYANIITVSLFINLLETKVCKILDTAIFVLKKLRKSKKLSCFDAEFFLGYFNKIWNLWLIL